MIKTKTKMIILVISISLLTGCWDYVGLNEITIVAGMAIDKDSDGKKYNVAFEIVNLDKSAQDQSIKTEILETSGATIFDAVRNAKKKTMNKLYFGNMPIAIISNQIAKEDGINSILDWFLRDAEVRETTRIIIAEGDSAKDILKKSILDSTSVSYGLQMNIESDNNTVSSTKNIEVYKIYNALHNDSQALSLPLFRVIENDNKDVVESNGIVLFKKDKLIGNLGPNDTKYYLIIKNCLLGGILPLKWSEKESEEKKLIDNISLEIKENSTNRSYSYEDKKFKFILSPDMLVYVGEYENRIDDLNEEDIKKLEKEAENMLKKELLDVIKKAKKDFKHDIFGLSNLVYGHDPELWKKVKKKWDDLFIEAEFEIKPTVTIINTALLK